MKVGIEAGDIAIVKKQETAEIGQIVVAIDDEGKATIKRLKFNDSLNHFYLHPENDAMDDIYPEKIRIHGVEVKVLKDLTSG